MSTWKGPSIGPRGPVPAIPDGKASEQTTMSPELESWILPEPARRMVDAMASFCGVPKTMPMVAALCAAATVVQGKVSVELAPGVVQPLTLWWTVLARTGGRKSTVLNFMKQPILDMQAAEERRIAPDTIEKSNERSRLEAQIQRMRRTAKAHKYTEGAQEHMQQLRELENELTKCQVPKAFQWLHDNINTPMLGLILEHNLESEDRCARVTIWGEEGTFWSNLLGRHTGAVMSETLNQGYSGSGLDSTRKLEGTRGLIKIHLDNIYMTLCVWAQPHYRELLRNQTLADNGFTGRLMVSECAVGRKPKLGSVKPPSQEILDGYSAWLRGLAAIPAGTVFTFSDAGQALLRAHVEETEDYVMANGDAQGWAGRSAERVARIAALCLLDCCQSCQMSERVGPTSPPHEGIIIKYLISSIYIPYLRAAQVQEPAVASPARDASDTLTALTGAGIRVGDMVTTRQLCRLKTWRLDRVIAACYELVELGALEPTDMPTRRGDRTLKEAFRVQRLTIEERPAPDLRVVADADYDPERSAIQEEK